LPLFLFIGGFRLVVPLEEQPLNKPSGLAHELLMRPLLAVADDYLNRLFSEFGAQPFSQLVEDEI
jgi:hypothetical protein